VSPLGSAFSACVQAPLLTGISSQAKHGETDPRHRTRTMARFRQPRPSVRAPPQAAPSDAAADGSLPASLGGGARLERARQRPCSNSCAAMACQHGSLQQFMRNSGRHARAGGSAPGSRSGGSCTTNSPRVESFEGFPCVWRSCTPQTRIRGRTYLLRNLTPRAGRVGN